MKIDFNWEDKKFLVFYAGSVALSFLGGMWFSNKMKETIMKEMEVRNNPGYNPGNTSWNNFVAGTPTSYTGKALPTPEEQYRMHQASVRAAKGMGYGNGFGGNASVFGNPFRNY